MTETVALFAAAVALIALLGCLVILGLVVKLFTEYTKDRAQDARQAGRRVSTQV